MTLCLQGLMRLMVAHCPAAAAAQFLQLHGWVGQQEDG